MMPYVSVASLVHFERANLRAERMVKPSRRFIRYAITVRFGDCVCELRRVRKRVGNRAATAQFSDDVRHLEARVTQHCKRRRGRDRPRLRERDFNGDRRLRKPLADSRTKIRNERGVRRWRKPHFERFNRDFVSVALGDVVRAFDVRPHAVNPARCETRTIEDDR